MLQLAHSSKNKQKGFTLIELLIVIGMIGILSGITIVIINPSRSVGAAKDAARNKNIKAIATALESYRQLEGIYPPASDIQNPESTLFKVYLKKWPASISNDGSIDEDNWAYKYYSTNNGRDFITYSPNSIGGCYRFQSDWGKVMSCPLTFCIDTMVSASECTAQ